MMLRTIYSGNQISGSIAFLSTIILLLILPPVTIDSSFSILFFGVLISLIIAALDPGKVFAISKIKTSVSKSSDLEIEQVEFAITGLFSKKILDHFVARIYMIFGLLLTIIFFIYKGIPETPFYAFDRSKDYSGIGTYIIPTLIIIIICATTVYWLLQQTRIDFEKDRITITNLTIFENYRIPIPYGYDWLEPTSKQSKLRGFLSQRRSVITTLEKYLSQYDYRSFDHAIKGELIDIANSDTQIIIDSIIKDSSGEQHQWFERIKELPNDNKIGKILEVGSYCISKTDNSMVETLNKVCILIDESKPIVNEFQSFLERIKQYFEFELPIEIINPSLIKELTDGQSSDIKLPLNDIHKNEITKTIDKNNSPEIRIFEVVYNWLSLIHNSAKFKETNDIEKPVIFEFVQSGMKLYLKTIRLEIGQGSSYSFEAGELIQFIMDYHVGITDKLAKPYNFKMIPTSNIDKFIKYTVSVKKSINAGWIYSRISEPCLNIIENKIYPQFFSRVRTTANIENFIDYIENVQHKIHEIKLNLVNVNSKYQIFLKKHK